MELAATCPNGTSIYVDYAHTPNALKTALKSLRLHSQGRLILVFGAGGDRDPSKRYLMGQVAAEFSDVAFLTDDNPRNENPSEIRAMILAGAPNAIEVPDRAEAILRAVDYLQAGDVLLIAGKGHESGQVIGNDTLPFDDVEQASIAVAALAVVS
jgi:UDP-N-acetylmuramoyl-L-alanyl-D-glutamate--2,6-diaminopimelate ligase